MTETKPYGIYVAEKAYQAPELGEEWRTHRFLVLSDDSTPIDVKMDWDNVCFDQELHFTRDSKTELLRAAAAMMKFRDKGDIKILGPVVTGDELTVRNLWNRALQVGVALNGAGVAFDNYKEMADPSSANNCDAGLAACFQVIGHSYDLSDHAGNFNPDLLDIIRDGIEPVKAFDIVAAARVQTRSLTRELIRAFR